MMMAIFLLKSYDKKYLQGKFFENKYVYAFEDIKSQAPIHILIIPKMSFCSFEDFSKKADSKFIYEFIKSIDLIVRGFIELKEGYRLITNIGKHGGQEVPHFHFHLLSGRPVERWFQHQFLLITLLLIVNFKMVGERVRIIFLNFSIQKTQPHGGQ